MPSPDSATAAEAAETAYTRALIRPTFWRRLRWRLELAAFFTAECVLGSLPLTWSARLGRLLGALAHACLKSRRKVVLRNLRIAFGDELRSAEIDALAAEIFRRAGANLLSALCTARLSPEALATAVEVIDRHLLDSAVARGKGVVLVLAHMGNWEALAQWFPRLLPAGTPGATVYRPLNNPLINARVSAQRRRLGISLFSKDENPLGMAGFLRRGGVLGVLSDQRAGWTGERVPFFGRLTSCTPIPAILARRTGAAVLGVSLRTAGVGRWQLRFHALNEDPTTAAISRLVERMMRVSPADVFWLQDRWRSQNHAPHLTDGKVPRNENPAPTKRRRALVCSGRPPTPEPDDVDYVTASPAAGESPVTFLLRLDTAAPRPLDYVVGGGPAIRRACKKLRIAWISGETS